MQATLDSLSLSWGTSGNLIPGAACTLACFGADTELLAKRGWLKYDQLRDDDEAAAPNPDTGMVEWQRLEAIHTHDYHGTLVQIRSRHLDVLVTPNHRMWAARRRGALKHSNRVQRRDLTPWEFKEARALTPGDILSGFHRPLRIDPNDLGVIDYHGTVWCVTVPNGLVVTRQDGKAIISGDSLLVAGGGA